MASGGSTQAGLHQKGRPGGPEKVLLPSELQRKQNKIPHVCIYTTGTKQKGNQGACEIQRNLKTQRVSGVTRENIASVCKIPREKRGGNLITITTAMVGIGRAMQYGSSEESAKFDLRMTRGRELQKGNKGNKRKRQKARRECYAGKGTKRDRERELWPRGRPLWRLGSEM